MDEILTPVDLSGPLDSDDLEILAADRQMLSEFIAAILANKRLAASIVHSWCKKNGYQLLPKKAADSLPTLHRPC